MGPITLAVVSGVLGGLVLAFVLFRTGRPARPGVSEHVVRTEPLSTDVINMARIKVAGVGGLGMVAMAVVVALATPQIRQAIALSLVLGVAFAAVLIVRRRRSGSAAPGDPTAGAHTMFRIDVPPADAERDGEHSAVRAGLIVLPSARVAH